MLLVPTEFFNPFPNKPWFLCVCSTSLLKTLWKKEKLLVTSNFSFSHSVLYLFRELSAIFNKFEIVVCKLFEFEKSPKFFVWEKVKKQQNVGLEKMLDMTNLNTFVADKFYIAKMKVFIKERVVNIVGKEKKNPFSCNVFESNLFQDC